MANSSEITQALQSHSKSSAIFKGCLPADQLPTNFSAYPMALVVNTDDSSQPGQHWVAFYAGNDQNLEMFDSFGHSPSKYKQFDYFIKQFDTVEFNGSRVQEHYSSTCGYYCMVYVLYKARGFSMEEFVQLFTNNYRNNDQVITSILNRTWKFNKTIYRNARYYQISKKFLPE